MFAHMKNILYNLSMMPKRRKKYNVKEMVLDEDFSHACFVVFLDSKSF